MTSNNLFGKKVISFVILGEPVAKGRPKVRIRGRFAQMYTPPKTREAEQDFQAKALKHVPPSPIEGPLSVTLKFHKQKPKSLPKKVKYWVKRPDLDNMIKLALDAMNKIFFVDDSQIVELHSIKEYSDWNGTEVIIRKI